MLLEFLFNNFVTVKRQASTVNRQPSTVSFNFKVLINTNNNYVFYSLFKFCKFINLLYALSMVGKL